MPDLLLLESSAARLRNHGFRWITGQQNKGKKHTEEHIAKHKAAMIRLYENPEYRARLGNQKRKQAQKQSKPEKILSSALDSLLFEYTGLNSKDYGQPISADIISKQTKLIVQVDGCYWHGCSRCGFENKKMKERDLRLTKLAESKGWTVIRFWECDIYEKLPDIVARIMEAYNVSKSI